MASLRLASPTVFAAQSGLTASPNRGGRRTIPSTTFANKSANTNSANGYTMLMSPSSSRIHRDMPSPHRACASTQGIQRRQNSVPPNDQISATSSTSVTPGRQPHPPYQQQELRLARRWPHYTHGTASSVNSTPGRTHSARLAHSPARARTPAFAGHPTEQALLAAAALSQKNIRWRSPGRSNGPREAPSCVRVASAASSATARGTGSYNSTSMSYTPPSKLASSVVAAAHTARATVSQNSVGIGSLHVPLTKQQEPTTSSVWSQTVTPAGVSKPMCLTSASAATLAAANAVSSTKTMSCVHRHPSIPPSTSATSLASLGATPTVSTEPTPTAAAAASLGIAQKTSLTPAVGNAVFYGQPSPMAPSVPLGAVAASLAAAALSAEEDSMRSKTELLRSQHACSSIRPHSFQTPVVFGTGLLMPTGTCSTGSICTGKEVGYAMQASTGEGLQEVVSPFQQAQRTTCPEVDKLDLDSLNENVKDVHAKVQSIHSMLEQSHPLNEGVAQSAVQEQMQQARDAERAALTAERERNNQLAETSRQLYETTLRLNDVEAQLWRAHEEAATHEHLCADLRRAETEEQERVKGQTAILERTRAELHEARCQMELQEAQMQDMHRSWRETEIAAEDSLQVSHLRKQLQLEVSKVTEKEAILGEREAQLRQREKDVAGQESAIRCAEQLRVALQQERVDFEAQRQETEDQLERQRLELLHQAQEQQLQHRRFSNAEKENRPLRQTVQQQKKWLWDLEGQLNKERVVTNFLTPGEYTKMVRAQQREHDLPQQVVDLKAKHMNLKLEAAKLHKLNEIYQRHMPNEAMDRALAEVQVAVPSSTVHEAGASSEPEGEETDS